MASCLPGCSGTSGGGDGQNGNKVVPAVEAVQARYGSLPLTERLSGLVKAKNQVEIYPQISAVVTKVFVENGDVVKRGQPLIQLRDREFQERLNHAKAGLQIALAQAKQAEARYNEIQSELKRTKQLIEKNLASSTELENVNTRAISAEADFELANARVEQARATAEESEEALSQTTISAPVDGTVGNREAEIGMLVNSNNRAFTIGKLDSVRISVVLTDRMLGYIKKGQRTEILSDILPFGAMSAKLTRISPFLHPVTHSTEADIDLGNPDRTLNPGMFVTVDVHHGESEKATLVPLSALYENPGNGQTGVYVTRDSLKGEAVGKITDGQLIPLSEPVGFTFVPVEVIAKGRMSAGVVGIEEGTWIVTIGHELLSGKDSSARVRKVNWSWVEQLQGLQRDDLIRELMQQQQKSVLDTGSTL